MTIIITGGFGFLGSNLANLFIRKGHNVIILDQKTESLIEIKGKYKKIKVDLSNWSSLKKIKVSSNNIILHCAGMASAALSFKYPLKDLNSNIISTANIIEWAKKNKTKKIIFASTFNVYKEKKYLSESDICFPKSIYSISKKASEDYIQMMCPYYKINWSILRMFNIYGPGQNPLNSDLGMINIFLNMAKKNNLINVKGSTKRFRDFVFIDDAVNAWYSCATKSISNSKIYNLGSGNKTSIFQLIKIIEKVLNKNLKIIEEKGTPGDFSGCYANISKAKKEIKFKTNTSLFDGLSLFNNWINEKYK